MWEHCYVPVEGLTQLEWDGYDFVISHTALRVSAWDTQWEHWVRGHMGGTGLQGCGRYPRHTRWFKGDWYVPSDFTRLTQELRPKVQVHYLYNLSTAMQSLIESVVLLCKQIGIWTPLILVVVVVMVAWRLISYREWVDKIISYKYNNIWGEWLERKKAVWCICVR